MTAEAPFRWTSAARTDIGLVRSRNEDALLEQGERGLWAVADGMGGHAYGDVASSMVVEALATLGDPGDIQSFVALTGDQLRLVNRRMRDEAVLRKVAMMGSTVVVLVASGRQVAYVWAGDSRIYLYRNGRLRQLTRDHSQAEEYKAHPPAFDAPPAMPNQITRALGAADTIELEYGTLEVRDGDVFLLCSDGLSNPVEDDAIAQVLAAGDCRHAADELVAQALANGGRDNISVVVVRADDASSDKTMINPAL